jgi:hypothetical protein
MAYYIEREDLALSYKKIKFLHELCNGLDSYAFRSQMFAFLGFSRFFFSTYALVCDYIDGVVGD